ncbi:hypothetical protein ACPX3P_000672 [Yersinia enterocolitica]|nr:hypothetical protein [Yersinia enterocolitica]HDL7179814.1 hypothetical protein [Yersinia enterocolitica]HEI6730333.1 hypothetical protein [Yersinia enterocolitica]
MKYPTTYIVLMIISSMHAAYARTLNPLPDHPQEKTVIVNNIKNKIVEVRSYNISLDGCDQASGMMKIEKIKMDSANRYPEEMTFRNMNNIRISMPTNFLDLDNASRSWTESLFSEGDWVSVQYTICGSGGFTQMTSISKHTERFPKAGVTVNKEN